MRKRIVAALFCIALGVAGEAAAQPAHASVFVEAGGVSNIAWDAHLSGGGITTPDLNDTGAGGTVSIGTWLAPRFSIRFEFAMPTDISASSTQSAQYGTNPLGVTLIDTRRTTLSDHERTAAVLVGFHTARRHGVQLGYLGGPVF